MSNRLRFQLLISVVIVFVGALWPFDNQKTIKPSEWSTEVRSTKDLASLDWKVRFRIDAAPSTPFAYISSKGQDIAHGFHLTVDLYGNGFLVFSDVGQKRRTNQIVWLGHPIIGEHELEMRFRQSDPKIGWRQIEVFFDDAEVFFHSGNPQKELKLGTVDFVPHLRSSSPSDAPSAGTILEDSLILKTWTNGRVTATQLILIFGGLIGLSLSIVERRKKQATE